MFSLVPQNPIWWHTIRKLLEIMFQMMCFLWLDDIKNNRVDPWMSRFHGWVVIMTYRQSLVKLGWLGCPNKTEYSRGKPDLLWRHSPPAPSLRSSFPFSSFPQRTAPLPGGSPRQRRTQPTDSCDSKPTGVKMEHRDSDFNILLATDSYKVTLPHSWRFQTGEEAGGERLMEESVWSQGGFITSPKAVQLLSVAGLCRLTAGRIARRKRRKRRRGPVQQRVPH